MHGSGVATSPGAGARPFAGARPLAVARKRRIPASTPAAAGGHREIALTSSTNSHTDITTTEPAATVTDLVDTSPETQTTDAHQTSESQDEASTVDDSWSPSAEPAQPETATEASPVPPSAASSSHSTPDEETVTTASPPVSAMKILNLANTVDSMKSQGCFSSNGNWVVPSRASLSSDCHHQSGKIVDKVKLSLLSTVSLKRAAIQTMGTATGIPVVHFGSNMTAIANGRNAFVGGSLHGGVNVLLGG